jgi:hypothetical protein
LLKYILTWIFWRNIYKSKIGFWVLHEYRDKFLQLSRYAPEDVNTDAKRQYRFLRGLVDPSTTS